MQLTVARLPSNVTTEIQVDSVCEFGVARGQLHYFDRHSGERLAEEAAG